MNDYYLWTLLEWCTKNNEDEQEQILDYTGMLKFMNENKSAFTAILGTAEFKAVEDMIREHVSDEQQHSEDLTKIYVKLSGIPIATD